MNWWWTTWAAGTLADGYRTRDIAAQGGQAIGTTDMGSHIIEALESGR